MDVVSLNPGWWARKVDAIARVSSIIRTKRLRQWLVVVERSDRGERPETHMVPCPGRVGTPLVTRNVHSSEVVDVVVEPLVVEVTERFGNARNGPDVQHFVGDWDGK